MKKLPVKETSKAILLFEDSQTEVLGLLKPAGNSNAKGNETLEIDLPGGTREAGESKKKALSRELGKELPGYKVEVLGWVGPVEHDSSRFHHVVDVCIGRVRPPAETPLPYDKTEHRGVVKLPLDTLVTSPDVPRRYQLAASAAAAIIPSMLAEAAKN